MASFDLSEDAVDEFRFGIGSQVRIALHHLQLPMPHDVSDLEEACAVLGEVAGGRMPQIVKAESLQVRALDRGALARAEVCGQK